MAARDGDGIAATSPHAQAPVPGTAAPVLPVLPVLPVPLSSFVGREQELAEVQRLLAGTRMLTLTGPGGAGKTRLAIEVARALDGAGAFAGGVAVASLAPLADGALIPQGIAAALGVREVAGRSMLASVQDAVGSRQLLLVLDNCEHLVATCAQVADALLQACPRLTVLATSRETLTLPGETVWPVPPLSVPSREHSLAPDALLGYEATRLFVERARAVAPSFTLTDANAASVAEICTRLDGLPLAIELAAARIRLLTAEQIAARLHDRFRLLTGGARTALPRHQTIRALVDWSYELLPDGERTLFCRLGIFAGDWSLPAAETVCSGDGIDPAMVLDLLGSLVDKSLVVAHAPAQDSGGEVRYRLLETLREYALERLGTGDTLTTMARRHARYFLELAERGESRYLTGDEAGGLSSIEPEHDHMRAALRHFLDAGDAERAARLAGALGKFWFFRGHQNEGRDWLREVMALAARSGLPAHPTAGYGKALHAQALMAHGQGDYAAGEALGRAELAVWRRLGNRIEEAYALFILGRIELWRGRRDAARPLFLESLDLARATGDRSVESRNLLWLAETAFDDGDDDPARGWAEDALATVEATGSQLNASIALRVMGDIEARRGDTDRARSYLEASVAAARKVGRWLAAWPGAHLANVLIEQHDHPGARALLDEVLRTYRDAGDRQGTAGALEGCARLAATLGRAAKALRLAGAAATLRASIGAPPSPAERSSLDRHLGPARAALGRRAAGEAWAAGQALSPAQATAEALAWLDALDPAKGQLAQPAPAGPLTAREREVAALVARGLSNRAIAAELVITEGTAERHMSNVLGKLGLSSRAQLAVWAIEHGLASPHPE